MKRSEQNDLARLIHIRDAAQKAQRAVEGKTRESLEDDEVLVLALIATLAIMGEAASNLTESFRETHPQIPWALMIGTRHRVVHAYYEVDLDIIWDTVTKNLPSLLHRLDDLLPTDDESA
ncbi:MAG: DUF86 domain-containing protein [Anaerolineae bacterium]